MGKFCGLASRGEWSPQIADLKISCLQLAANHSSKHCARQHHLYCNFRRQELQGNASVTGACATAQSRARRFLHCNQELGCAKGTRTAPGIDVALKLCVTSAQDQMTTQKRNLNYPFQRLGCRLLGAGMLLTLAGCVSDPTNPRDPFEPFNRKSQQFNEGVDAVVLKPVATVYQRQVPALMRTGVGNFFGNLSDGWSFVNCALQFKFADAGDDFMRLNVNTFFGLGGLLDIASDLNIERHREDFGQTLGRWGVPAGPYVMLPLLGPSTVRDTLALTLDSVGDPVHSAGLYGMRAIDQRANSLRVGALLDEAALDKYTFIRDSYLQKRRADIFDSEPPDIPAEPVEGRGPTP